MLLTGARIWVQIRKGQNRSRDRLRTQESRNLISDPESRHQSQESVKATFCRCAVCRLPLSVVAVVYSCALISAEPPSRSLVNVGGPKMMFGRSSSEARRQTDAVRSWEPRAFAYQSWRQQTSDRSVQLRLENNGSRHKDHTRALLEYMY